VTRSIRIPPVPAAVAAAALCAMVGLRAGAENPGPAAEPADGPKSPRVVAFFDFDERDEGNFEKLPRNWLPVVDEGFPRHTADRTGFDADHAVSGQHSLRLQTDGGSAALVVRRGVLAAVPGAAYRLNARLRTADMQHSRARLTAYIVDDEGERLQSTVRHTAPALSNGRWRKLSLQLDADEPDAAWIILRLELLQPDRVRSDDLGEQTLRRQDIGATAWFDDVALVQVPRLGLSIDSKTGVDRDPQSPALDVVVEDFANDVLTATLTVWDHRRQLVDRDTRRLDRRQPPRWRWRPKIERFGWYSARLAVRNGEGPVGQRVIEFCWLPERARGGEAGAGASPRLGINADRLPEDLSGVLPAAMAELGAGAVIVPIWRPGRASADAAAMVEGKSPLLRALVADRREITLAFAGVPDDLAQEAKVDTDRPLSLFATDRARWRDEVERYAAELAGRVDRWQAASTAGTEAAHSDKAIEGYAALRGVLGRLVADGSTVLPWPADAALTDGARDAETLLIRVPVALRPEHFADYAEDWPTDSGSVHLSLEALPRSRFDHDARAADLTHRLLEAWAGPFERVYVDLPWRSAEPETGRAVGPGPLAAALANLEQALVGRAVVGRLDLAEGVPAYILDGQRGGALVAWAQGDHAEAATVKMRLGESPRARDVWANPVEMTSDDGRHVLDIGPRPLIIEGIDSDLARFRAGLRITPELLESVNRTHDATLTVTNPWDQALHATLHIKAPPRWRVQPARLSVAIDAGGTVEKALSIWFPLSETAGRKLLPVRMDVETDKPYTIDVKLPLEIGLEDIEFQPHLVIERRDGRRDAKATLIVTNHGDRPRSFYAFAMGRDQPTQQRIISRLGPGQTAIKHLRLPDAGRTLSGESIRVGLRAMDRPAMLSKMLEVP